MYRNFFTTMLRFLKQNKLFASINVLGLSLALAVSFIILLFIINEFSYNQGYRNRKQIYRVLNNYLEFKTIQAGTPYVLASALKNDFPQVEHAVRTRFVRGFRLKQNNEFIPVSHALATDSEIFELFGIALTTQIKNALDDPNSIVLSVSLAQKFFPGQNPVGKEIVGLINNQEQLFVVKDVYEDLPVNSTLTADCFISGKWTLEPVNQTSRIKNAEVNWDKNFWTTWVMLKKGADKGVVENQFRNLELKYLGEKPTRKYLLQPLSDVYLHSGNVMNSGLRGNMKNIRIFSSIAFLIILVATFNYIILSTAVSSGRTKEIGIRKTYGAGVTSIRKQLLGESVFLSFAVLPVALLLALAGRPYAESLFQTKLNIIPANVVVYGLVYLLLTLLIGIVSGLYTSSFLSKLKTISILKNSTVTGKRKSYLRHVLIIIQLVIFCSFISGTMIIRSQYKFALMKDLGFRNSNILLIETGLNFKNYSAFINSLKSFPDVTMAGGASDGLPMLGSASFMMPRFKDNSHEVKVEGLAVDYHFIETMGIQVLQGRSFSEEFGGDPVNATLLNETAVKELGLEDPVGQKFAGMMIIGIVKDFNLHSIHSDIPPLIITITDKWITQVAVNYVPGSLNHLLPMIRSEWKKLAPGMPFQYQTIEELIREIYSSEKNLSVIVSIFALFSLLIATFGLFGLTLFIARTRTKEIGVKKVMGSSGRTIIISFLRENIIMVCIAAVLAIPVTWYFMNRWLSNFSFRVSINLWFFVVAFVVALIVVGITVFFQSYRASHINPVEALRYE